MLTELAQPCDKNGAIPRNMTGLAAQLKKAGYATHQVGKWDAGMATPDHTPRGRGFNESLCYFEHKNDFWSKGIMQSECLAHGAPFSVLRDLWEANASYEGPARIVDGEYEELTFRRRALQLLLAHVHRRAIPLG